MRAIDADAFKEYITSACEDMKHLFNDGGAVAKLITESFCKDIDEQPTIQPEPHWIPVTERLPKKCNTIYLATVDCGKYGRAVGQRFFFDSNIGWSDKDVIAWTPLPEPYKGVTT